MRQLLSEGNLCKDMKVVENMIGRQKGAKDGSVGESMLLPKVFVMIYTCMSPFFAIHKLSRVSLCGTAMITQDSQIVVKLKVHRMRL